MGQRPEGRADPSVLRRNRVPRLDPQADGRADSESAASRVRTVEPGHSRPCRCDLCRLPHATVNLQGHDAERPLGAQPAAQHQGRVSRLSPEARRGRHRERAQGACRTDPGPPLEVARARDDGADGADRRSEVGERSRRSDADLATARYLQRRAQFYLDFVEAENSTGFHAPQEAARILGESLDYARQGQLAIRDPSFKPTVAVIDIPQPAAAPAPAVVKP